MDSYWPPAGSCPRQKRGTPVLAAQPHCRRNSETHASSFQRRQSESMGLGSRELHRFPKNALPAALLVWELEGFRLARSCHRRQLPVSVEPHMAAPSRFVPLCRWKMLISLLTEMSGDSEVIGHLANCSEVTWRAHAVLFYFNFAPQSVGAADSRPQLRSRKREKRRILAGA